MCFFAATRLRVQCTGAHHFGSLFIEIFPYAFLAKVARKWKILRALIRSEPALYTDRIESRLFPRSKVRFSFSFSFLPHSGARRDPRTESLTNARRALLDESRPRGAISSHFSLWFTLWVKHLGTDSRNCHCFPGTYWACITSAFER